jgi:hypothetical protein
MFCPCIYAAATKYFVGYGISLLGGHVFTKSVNNWMRREKDITLRTHKIEIEKNVPNKALMPWLVGVTERFLYTTALLERKPEFIGLWLGLKFAGNWRNWDPQKANGWGNVNIFLAGNAMSLIFAYLGAKIIQWMI